MQMREQIFSAIGQVAVIFGIACLVYGIVWLFFRQKLAGQSLFDYLGVVPTRGQLDRSFWIIWLWLVVFAILSAFLELRFSEAFRQILMSENSPYGKILKTGFDSSAVFKGLIYCFIQASCAEEILFRGLFAKRLFYAVGFSVGNIMQAFIFWLMHLLIFRFITGEWFSFLQLVTFITSFGLGIVLGFVNFRKNGESIAPSWILHGTVNFVSFLTLAILWPK